MTYSAPFLRPSNSYPLATRTRISIGSLATIYQAAVAAGMDPEAEDIGIRQRVTLKIGDWLGGDNATLRRGFNPHSVSCMAIATALAIHETALAIEDPNADPVGTMTAISEAAIAAWMSADLDLIGLRTVTNLVNAETERLAELASRPRVEITDVTALSGSFGAPEFRVTFRNNYTSPVIGVDFRLYAYNVFGDGPGGECGRFPTYYEGTNSSSAVEGDTFS